MNVLAIGDIHGRTNWQEAPIATADKVIFMGDYVDSKEFSDEQTDDVLRQIVALKEAEPDKFVLLLGNHDVAYLHYPEYRCSGFRFYMQKKWTAFYREHHSAFQVAYQWDNYLFTHAGVSRLWARKHGIGGENVADALNDLQATASGREALFECGAIRGGNPGATGGVVWADQRETAGQYIPGFHQIVGHTPLPEIRSYGDEGSSITYIDVLGKTVDFWERTF